MKIWMLRNICLVMLDEKLYVYFPCPKHPLDPLHFQFSIGVQVFHANDLEGQNSHISHQSLRPQILQFTRFGGFEQFSSAAKKNHLVVSHEVKPQMCSKKPDLR